MQALLLDCDISTYLPTYSFVVIPYLEARTENVTKNSPEKINSLTQASCTSFENKKKMKKKITKIIKSGAHS